MPLQHYKLGLLPSPEPPKLRLGTYLDLTQLPPLPDSFGHYNLFPKDGWGMLGNDQVGDCAIAGPGHIEMLWNAIAKTPTTFSTSATIQDYSTLTGYTPSDPNTDQGTDIVTAAEYWLNTGFLDAQGNRHKIGAYLGVSTSKLDHIYYSCWLFGATGIGVALPASAEAQFQNGQPWTVVQGDDIMGGHYVPLVGRDKDYLYGVTWGRLQPLTEEWLTTYVNEVAAYLSQEDLINGKTPEGFNYAELQTDLRHVGSIS